MGFQHFIATLLTAAFPVAIAAAIWRRFGGWASKAQLWGGAGLSLMMIVIALTLVRSLPAGWAPPVQEIEAYIRYDALFEAAFPEEFARWVCLFVLHYLLLTRDPREFLMGATALGLGFGVIENVNYLLISDKAVALGALRGVLTAPIHMGLSILGAVGVWRWRDAGGSITDALACFAAAVLLHATYNATQMYWARSVVSPQLVELSGAGSLLVALLVVAIIAFGTLVTLRCIDMFRNWSAQADHHDRDHHATQALRSGPTLLDALPSALVALAALCALTGLFFQFSDDPRVSVDAPVMFGVALSLLLWSRAIRKWDADPF